MSNKINAYIATKIKRNSLTALQFTVETDLLKAVFLKSSTAHLTLFKFTVTVNSYIIEGFCSIFKWHKLVSAVMLSKTNEGN